MTVELSPEDLAALIDALGAAELTLQEAANDLNNNTGPVLFALEHGGSIERLRKMATDRKMLRARLETLAK